MADIHEQTNCRLCKSSNLSLVLDFGLHAVGCSFPANAQEVLGTQVAPLQLFNCTQCGLLQLGHTVEARSMYNEGYGYRSGITETMRKHLADAVKHLRKCVPNLQPGNIVLDIGSNDGTLLKNWPEEYQRVGIDPICSEFLETYVSEGLYAIPDLFSAELFFDIVGKDARAKAVTSIAMLYDLEDPVHFAKEVASVLAPDGAWLIEVMYAGSLFGGAWDMVHHEHLTYLRLRDVMSIVEAAGLYVFSASVVPINGGTLRCLVRPAQAKAKFGPGTSGLLVAWSSDEHGRHAMQLEKFASRTVEQAGMLTGLLKRLNHEGKSVYVLGASQKGNTILQYCSLYSDLLGYAVERDPRKDGKYTPGTTIPIISEQRIHSGEIEAPDYYLVLPWQFRSEILAREHPFVAQGGRMIFPLPTIEIVGRPYG